MGKKFIKRKPQNEEMALQITSMADIFTILLVFLLKSFSMSAMNLTPSKDVQLAQSFSAQSGVEALKLEVSRTAVQVEGIAVTNLAEFRPVSADVDTSGALKSLQTALKKERDRQLMIAKDNADVKVDPRIIIVADQRVPYATVKAVLASAAIHGYTDFKLAVIKPE